MSDKTIVLDDIEDIKAFLSQGDDESIQEVIFVKGEVNNGESE